MKHNSLITILFILIAICAAQAKSDKAIKTLAYGEKHCIEIQQPSSAWEVEVRAAIVGNKNSNGIGKDSWFVTFSNDDGQALFSVTLRWGNENFGDPFDRRFIRVNLWQLAPDDPPQSISETDIYSLANFYDGFNTLSLVYENARLSIWLGDKKQAFVNTIDIPDFAPTHACVQGTRKIKLASMQAEVMVDPRQSLATNLSPNDISQLVNTSTDPIEGFWDFLDRNTDAKFAELGGKYQLAILKTDNQPGAYDIIYISGATINASQWQPGMIKGRIHPTQFINHYTLEWFDSDFTLMNDELTADFIDNAILTLHFPLFNSELRFSRQLH